MASSPNLWVLAASALTATALPAHTDGRAELVTC